MHDNHREITKRLINMFGDETVDWNKVKACIIECKSWMNEMTGDDTLVSEVIQETGYNHGGKNLERLTRLFLENGYDVNANEKKNGWKCLYNLCWSSYDPYILDAARILLQAGADPSISDEDDLDEDEPGMLGVISWKLAGLWNEGDFDTANIYIAYYKMIEYAMQNREYAGIDNYTACIGKKLKNIKIIDAKNGSVPQEYTESMILEFEDKQLVINQYAECCVDPYYTNKKCPAGHTDEDLSLLIGSELTEVRFLNQIIQMYRFSYGYDLFISSNDKKERSGQYAILPAEDQDISLPEHCGIRRILLESGRTYNSEYRVYAEDFVILDTVEHGIYAVYPMGDFEQKTLHISKYPSKLSERFTRMIVADNIEYRDQKRNSKGEIVWLSFSTSQGYLYLREPSFENIEILMTDNETDRAITDRETVRFKAIQFTKKQ